MGVVATPSIELLDFSFHSAPLPFAEGKGSDPTKIPEKSLEELINLTRNIDDRLQSNFYRIIGIK